ncbi:hypothetical protein VTL71DRAFT_15162 [Oculimacula yallundae]|uniref:Uncharacterized protein n=1 Tax=Oculimacula yallundae TaxID=86028 RepID=A0ABR4CI32_9HELO
MDRMLIEVRKPGRPLESCGHNLNTCQCGRVAEVFAMNDLLSDPSAGSFGTDSNSNFVVTTPPTPIGSYASMAKPKPKPRTKSQSKVTKRSKKKILTPPTSPLDKSSPGPTTSFATAPSEQSQTQPLTPDTVPEQLDPLSPSGQGDLYSQSMQYILPNPQQYQSQAPASGGYINYSSGEYTGPGGHQILYEQPMQPHNYSIRVEDVSMGQNSHLQQRQDTHLSEGPFLARATRLVADGAGTDQSILAALTAPATHMR